MLDYDYDIIYCYNYKFINILKIIIILKTSVWLSPLEIFIIILMTLKGTVTDFLQLPGFSGIWWAADT